MHLFATATDVMAFSYFTGYVVFMCAFFLVGIESGRQVSPKFRSFVLFCRVMLSITTSFATDITQISILIMPFISFLNNK